MLSVCFEDEKGRGSEMSDNQSAKNRYANESIDSTHHIQEVEKAHLSQDSMFNR